MTGKGPKREVECPECLHRFMVVKHGTRTSYSYGCRCPECVSAEYAYHKVQQKKRKLKLAQERKP